MFMNIKIFTTSICLTLSQTFFAGWDTLINIVQATEPEKSPACVIETVKSAEAWEHCLDKTVQLQGTHASPAKIMQHPVMVMQTPQQTDSESRQYQDYLEIGGRQIILITQAEIPCENAMEVSGLLKKIDLGGQKGTKGEYKNFVVEVSDFQCIKAIEH
jgi:hypothetical protein